MHGSILKIFVQRYSSLGFDKPDVRKAENNQTKMVNVGFDPRSFELYELFK